MDDSIIPKILSPQKTINYIVNWLDEYLKKSNLHGFVVGVSGGIDSALTSTLCGLTGKKTLCLEMNIYQEQQQVNRATDHINWLKSICPNIESKSINLTLVFDSFSNLLNTDNHKSDTIELALANSRSRLRMMTLYYYASKNKFLVAGTGNKVEDFGVGFFTKYGDGGVDISPVADLLKSHIYQLAKHLKIIDSILEAKPTDGLWTDNRSDLDQLGASYDELEWAMNISESTKNKKDLTEKQIDILNTFKSFNNQNKHKMEPIPICKIPKELFTN